MISAVCPAIYTYVAGSPFNLWSPNYTTFNWLLNITSPTRYSYVVPHLLLVYVCVCVCLCVPVFGQNSLKTAKWESSNMEPSITLNNGHEFPVNVLSTATVRIFWHADTHTVTYTYVASVIILSSKYRSPLPVGSHIVNLDNSAACLQARPSSCCQLQLYLSHQIQTPYLCLMW